MKRVLKWIGLGLCSLFVVLLVAATVLVLLGNRKLNQTYVVEPEPVVVEADTAVLERGQYLVSISCMGCHGDNLGGTPFFEDPALGNIPAPNLTSGQGGAVADLSEADFVRAIRHGVDPHGKPLMIMPSTAFWHYSDADLAAIIAYVQSVPPVDNELGDKELGLLGRVLVGAGALDVLAAEQIDHTGPRPAPPTQQVDAAYGKYLVNVSDCRACHGAALSGGQPPEPGAPAGPSLTIGSELPEWDVADFITTMRSGNTPDGRSLNPAYMPWPEYGRMTDDDLTALYLYLQSQTAVTEAEE